MARVCKNILFIRSDRFGEFLLSLPVLKLTRLNFPQSKIFLLAKKPNIELASGADFIDHFLEYQEGLSGWLETFKLTGILKKENIDCVVILNPRKEFHLAALLARVKTRIGYDRKWGFCLNVKIKDRKQEAQKHEVEYNLDLIKLLCPKVFIPDIDLNPDSQESLEFLKNNLDIKKQYIVLHPFSSNTGKKIEKKFWEELIIALKKQNRNNIVIIGGPEEVEESLKFTKGLPVNNVTGKLKIRNLAAFLKHNCSVFIGLDSGPMHLAAMLKRPVVGLFNISNSKRWSPFNTESLIVGGKDIESFMQRINDIVEFTCGNT